MYIGVVVRRFEADNRRKRREEEGEEESDSVDRALITCASEG